MSMRFFSCFFFLSFHFFLFENWNERRICTCMHVLLKTLPLLVYTTFSLHFCGTFSKCFLCYRLLCSTLSWLRWGCVWCGCYTTSIRDVWRSEKGFHWHIYSTGIQFFNWFAFEMTRNYYLTHICNWVEDVIGFTLPDPKILLTAPPTAWSVPKSKIRW